MYACFQCPLSIHLAGTVASTAAQSLQFSRCETLGMSWRLREVFDGPVWVWLRRVGLSARSKTNRDGLKLPSKASHPRTWKDPSFPTSWVDSVDSPLENRLFRELPSAAIFVNVLDKGGWDSQEQRGRRLGTRGPQVAHWHISSAAVAFVEPETSVISVEPGGQVVSDPTACSARQKEGCSSGNTEFRITQHELTRSWSL